MVLKIERAIALPVPAAGDSISYLVDHHGKQVEPAPQSQDHSQSQPPPPRPLEGNALTPPMASKLAGNEASSANGGTSNVDYQTCAGCGVTDSHAPGSLLLFDDPEEDVNAVVTKRPEDEKRYCAKCMTGKKVRVFWPVDSQWYIAEVKQYNDSNGEHLLKYPDGDNEWVRIGEDHTTNACYYNSLAGGAVNGGVSRSASSASGNRTENGEYTLQLGGISNGVSFALSGLGTRSMSHGDFGLSRVNTEEEGKPLAPGATSNKTSQRNPYQQLNLDRTASSMSSFGLGRQHSFHHQEGAQQKNGPPPFHLLSPNFTHSFSSKFGDDPLVDLAPPTSSAKRARTGKESNKPPTLPYAGTESESWDHHHPHKLPPSQKQGQPPLHYDYHHQRMRDSANQQQQREEGSGKESAISPGQRDGPSTTPPGHVDNSSHPGRHPSAFSAPPSHPSYHGHHQNGAQPPGSHWGPHHPPPSFGATPNFYDAQQHRFPYSMPHPPHHTPSEVPPATTRPSSVPSLITPGANDPSHHQPHTHSQKNTKVSQQQHRQPPHITQNDTKNKKAPTKAWAKEEDDQLLDMVLAMKHPLKWSIIASSLSTDRTGKQCRERYVNHLNPRLKSSDWTPIEDCIIWRLYATSGTQWAKMSKVIPGRTDNGIKNRFHNLKRQLDREEESRLRAPEPKNYDRKVHLDKIREIPKFLKGPIEELWNVKRGIGMIAANTTDGSQEEETPESSFESMIAAQKSSRFGPFETVSGATPIQCLRCGLFMPSVQCGTEICTKTRWCKACTMVPMHLGGHVLRECLNLRKRTVDEVVDSVENLPEGSASKS